jgi:hypothetical protein
MKTSLRSICGALALALLSGCLASVPLASDDFDAAAKTFATTPDKATLYVYRNEFLGAAIPMKITIDGEHVGTTAANTYLLLMVDPGRHQVASVAENTSEIVIDARAGQNYFFWQEVKMGTWTAATKLHQVDEAQGREAVMGCKLVNTF